MLATAQSRCRRCVVGVWVGFLLGTGDWDCWEGCLGWLRGAGPALAGIVRGVMAFALTRDGDWVAAIQCSLRPNPAAAGVWSGCGWVFCWGQGIGIVGWVLGVASRDWACACRDRSGGRAFALRAMGVGLLRSDARYGPVPLPPVCGRGMGGFFAGDRGLGLLGGLLGVALRGWACARRDRSGGDGFRADARWGLGCCDPMLATAQPRCRRCVVGVWVVFLLGTGDWDCWVGCLGWLRGVGPALAGIVREVGLSR